MHIAAPSRRRVALAALAVEPEPRRGTVQIAERRAGAGRRPNQRAAAAIAGTAMAGCGLRRGSQTPPADPGLEQWPKAP